ncbi:MAG: hypothetical protein AB7I42_25640 [Bradyrhizobium sp.]|uniref:hypothetical protein n=1 Tax=Bradyrhizobium sp. TaxID=376 RepID=UPI003D15068B
MFKFARKREVLWPVTVLVPLDDGSGQVAEMEIRIRYRLLTSTELNDRAREELEVALSAGVEGGAVDGMLAQLSPDRINKAMEDLKGRITGWEGLADEAGEPLAFTPENLDGVLEIPYLRTAIHRGLVEASQGAPAKNSKAGSVS